MSTEIAEFLASLETKTDDELRIEHGPGHRNARRGWLINQILCAKFGRRIVTEFYATR